MSDEAARLKSHEPGDSGSRLPLLLLLTIPAASVVMGVITLVLAFSGPSQELPEVAPALNKTSWQEPVRELPAAEDSSQPEPAAP